MRELGAYERFLCVAGQDHPDHFVVAAEFDVRLDARQVQSALDRLIDRHPLLSVSVTQRDGKWMFELVPDDVRAHVQIVDDPEQTWQRQADRELDHPFNGNSGPLVRLTLLRSHSYSALLLCLDHTIADGISAVFLLGDLVAFFNGGELPKLALQPSLETLIDTRLSSVKPLDVTQSNPDPRMAAPLPTRPPGSLAATSATAAMGIGDTATLVQRCRDEQTTVHAALLVAAAQVRGTDLAKDFIRIASPINIRSLLGVGQDCGVYLSSALTGVPTTGAESFWQQAKELTAPLQLARSPAGVRAMMQAMQQALPADASSAEIHERLASGFPTEMMVTNLGNQDLGSTGPTRPTAIWGPMIRNSAGDCSIGVVTYQSQLRMAACGFNLAPAFLERLMATLTAAARD